MNKLDREESEILEELSEENSLVIHLDHLYGNRLRMVGRYDFIKGLQLVHLFSTQFNKAFKYIRVA